jgi:hypothetical protein
VLDDLTMNDLWDNTKALALGAWARTTRRVRAAGAFLLFLYDLALDLVTSNGQTNRCHS